jgi:hypothetical protein
MMNTTRLSGLAVTAAALLAVGFTPTSADAADRCLSRSDFRAAARSVHVDAPMTRRDAHRMFGIDGRTVGFHTRVYRGCGEGSRAWLEFDRGPGGRWLVYSTAYTSAYFG